MKESYIDIEKRRREYFRKLIRGDRPRVREARKRIYHGKKLNPEEEPAKGDNHSIDNKYKY